MQKHHGVSGGVPATYPRVGSEGGVGASISAIDPILRTCSGARVSSESKVDIKVVGNVHGEGDGVVCCENRRETRL